MPSNSHFFLQALLLVNSKSTALRCRLNYQVISFTLSTVLGKTFCTHLDWNKIFDFAQSKTNIYLTLKERLNQNMWYQTPFNLWYIEARSDNFCNQLGKESDNNFNTNITMFPLCSFIKISDMNWICSWCIHKAQTCQRWTACKPILRNISICSSWKRKLNLEDKVK